MLKAAVIDANTTSRNLLTTVLVNGGYEVIAHSNLSSAGVASIIKLRPQIVCIDIGQPDEEGMSWLDALRNGLPKTLLFMVSGKIDSNTVQGALQRGVHGFIVKPFNAATVLMTIRNAVIQLARQHRAKTAESGAHTTPEGK